MASKPTSAGWSRLSLAVLATSFTSLPTFLTMEAMRACAYSMYTAVLPFRFSISSKLNLRRQTAHYSRGKHSISRRMFLYTLLDHSALTD